MTVTQPSPSTTGFDPGSKLSRSRATVVGGRLLGRLNIGEKLTLGFGILVALTLIVVGLNYLGSFRAVTNMNRTSDLRAPSALASARSQADLLRMLGEVRGYLALGDDSYRDSYEKARAAFESDLDELEALLLRKKGAKAGTPGLDSDAKLLELKSALGQWHDLPQRLFNLRSDQLRREPALRILIVQGNPLIASIVLNIKGILATQQRREASPANMTLLADLASFQSSFYAMISGLRGYVTTKRETFKYEYQSNLAINDTAWGNLDRQVALFDPAQKTKFDKIAHDRETFLALPSAMFA